MNIMCLSVSRRWESNRTNVPGFNSFRAYPINTLSAAGMTIPCFATWVWHTYKLL